MGGVGVTPTLAGTQNVRAGLGRLSDDEPGCGPANARVAQSGRDYRDHPRQD